MPVVVDVARGGPVQGSGFSAVKSMNGISWRSGMPAAYLTVLPAVPTRAGSACQGGRGHRCDHSL